MYSFICDLKEITKIRSSQNLPDYRIPYTISTSYIISPGYYEIILRILCDLRAFVSILELIVTWL